MKDASSVIETERSDMSASRDCCIHESIFSECLADKPAGCLGHRFVYSILRLAVVAAICCRICAANLPAVRAVRVPTVDREDIPFTHVSLETATVRGIVERIVQDDRGFLWFGTNHGLLRYDGYQFRAFVHDPEDPNSISGTNVLALFKDRLGNLWVGSDQHVDSYDPVSGVFKHVLPDAASTCGPSGIARDITQDREGMIWVATDNGLVRFDPSTSKLKCYQHRQDDGSSIASNLIKTMLESRNGIFWVATTLGIEALNRQTGKVSQRVTLRGPSGTPLSLDGNKISLFEDHAGVLWITIPAGQECGLVSFDPRSGLQSAYLFGPGPAEAGFSILEDEDQSLWFGQWQQGIIRLDGERKRAIRYRNNPKDRSSVSAGAVITLLQDHEDRIWAGLDPPIVDRFNPLPSPFQTYHHDRADPDNLSNAVVSVLQDSRGILWIGGLGGLDRWDRKTGQVTHYMGRHVSGRPIFKTVHAIAEDRAGYLWFGEWGNGLDRFDPRTGRFRFYNHDRDNPTSLSSDIVESLFVDSRGTLWVGTYDALNRFDPKTERFQAYRSVSSGLSQYRTMAEDPSGALWLGSLGNGLHRFDPATGRFTVYRNAARDPRSLSNDIVNAVYVDRSGTVWAGTSDGLCRLDQTSHTFTSYYTRDGLASSVVEGILEDDDGDLWLSTSDGLSRFNPRARTFRNYYAGDGLPGNEFRFAAASKGSADEMFFGSTSGLLAFFPQRVIADPSPPRVVLTDFWLFGERLRAGEKPLERSISYLESLTLGPRQNIFSFEFSALSYSNPTRNRYRYRLEGLEQQWNERDGTRRLVTYTTLPARDYVFRVQGSNSHGVWNENGASLRIRILPPWWSTWWFRAAFMGVALTLLWALYELRVRQLQREERRLRDVIETMPTFAWTALPDGSVDFVNRHWQEYTGLSAGKTAGWGWEAAVHPADLKRHVEKWRASLTAGELFENEVRYRRGADGQYRWFWARAVPLRDARGKILKWYGISTDIEDRKRAEQERETLQADLAHVNRVSMMGELAASLSHELKQPIAAAIMNANTCMRWLKRDEPVVDEALEATRRIVKDGSRAAEVIDRIRSLYKKSPPQRHLVDVNQIIGEMIVLLRGEANRCAVSIRAELAADLAKITADRVQLQQVLMNLMLNAIEAMKETGGALMIKSQMGQDDHLLISVSDTGVGLPAEQADQIFNAFFTTKPQGSGMGLAISRSIVESHGGCLWATANSGRGAVFHFTLPTKAKTN
jgi:PAS domain S-box-containing protein